MGTVMATVREYDTIQVRFEDSICHLKIHRPDANNTINDRLVAECNEVLALCETRANVVVISGSPEVFCFGADFKGIAETSRAGASAASDSAFDGPGPLYDLWLRMATGPYVTVSHVRGKANAGGVGFVAASDIVIADETAQFSLSELLFGLYPACVLPFLVRRIGFQKSHYMTLMTQPLGARQACEWGLVDACEAQSEASLRRHLQRLRRLSKSAIGNYKGYMRGVGDSLQAMKAPAVAANAAMFSDPDNVSAIVDYVERGVFPWERG